MSHDLPNDPKVLLIAFKVFRSVDADRVNLRGGRSLVFSVSFSDFLEQTAA